MLAHGGSVESVQLRGATISFAARPTGSWRILQLFQVGGLTEFRALQSRIDVAQQPGQHRSGANLDEASYALRRQVANGVHPADRIRNLLIESLTRVAGATNLPRLPVIDQRNSEIGEHRRVQIGGEALLSGLHKRAME